MLALFLKLVDDGESCNGVDRRICRLGRVNVAGTYHIISRQRWAVL